MLTLKTTLWRNVARKPCCHHSTILLSQGCGIFGALGHPTNFEDEKYFRTLRLSSLPSQTVMENSHSFTKVAAGWGHSAFLSSTGQLYFCGRPFDFLTLMRLNRFRMLSSRLGTAIAQLSAYFNGAEGVYEVPTLCDGLDGVSDVKCSAGLTIASTIDGSLYAFGNNRWGQCGINSEKIAHCYEPIRIQLGEQVILFDVGLQHVLAVGSSGALYSWGKGNRGQLGAKEMDHLYAPGLIEGINSVIDVSAGFSHSAAVTGEGAVFIWGKGMSETLKATKGVILVEALISNFNGLTALLSAGGVRIFEDQATPRKVLLPGGRKAVEISSSNFVVVIRASDETLWAMGVGEYDRNSVSTPVEVLQPLFIDDYSYPLSGSGGLSSSPENPNASKRAHINGSVVMKKGHQRVRLLYPPDSSPFKPGRESEYGAGVTKMRNSNSNSNSTGPVISTRVYEVVLHADTAFLQRVELDIPAVGAAVDGEVAAAAAAAGDGMLDRRLEVLDISSGWQHSLLLLK